MEAAYWTPFTAVPMALQEVRYILHLFAEDQDQSAHLSSKRLTELHLLIQDISQLILHTRWGSFIYLFPSRE